MAKRKTMAKREPNGKPSRALADRSTPSTSPAESRRLRDAALTGMRQAEWGTQLGRLFLAHKITSEHYQAGQRWSERAGLYRQALDCPAADPRAMDFDKRGGEPIDPDSEQGKREVKRHIRAAASFVDTHAALLECGSRVVATVRSVCERDEAPVGHQGLLDLSTGLQRIAEFLGLTGHRKSQHVR
jgi:hypothetical protein